MPRYSLDTITIDGFRGLHHCTLEDMGRVNILVGPNNCGKTSVLEAVSILCDPFNPDEWLSMISRRDPGRQDENRIESFRWCFDQRELTANPESPSDRVCEMVCTGTSPLRSLKISHREFMRAMTREEIKEMFATRESTDSFLTPEFDFAVLRERRGSQINHEIRFNAHEGWLPGMLGEYGEASIDFRVWEGLEFRRKPRSNRRKIKTSTLTPFSYQINSMQVVSQTNIFSSGGEDMALDLVRQFDADVEDIRTVSVYGQHPSLHLKHRKLGSAPLSIFGDAVRRVVLLANTIPLLRGGGVLLLDEAETGIHASKINNVFSWLIEAARSLNVQIIATTHSLEAVDAVMLAAGDDVDDVVTYHLDQAEDRTRVRRTEGEMLLRLRQKRGLDVR